MERKYHLSKETIDYCGRKLYRIIADKDFSDVKKGDKGGWIEKEDNLSQTNNAWVYGNADYIVFKNWWSSGRFFTWTRSNNMWKVGCFYGSGEELIKKAYNDSELSGREYERVVKMVEDILADKPINNDKK